MFHCFLILMLSPSSTHFPCFSRLVLFFLPSVNICADMPLDPVGEIQQHLKGKKKHLGSTVCFFFFFWRIMPKNLCTKVMFIQEKQQCQCLTWFHSLIWFENTHFHQFCLLSQSQIICTWNNWTMTKLFTRRKTAAQCSHKHKLTWWNDKQYGHYIL